MRVYDSLHVEGTASRESGRFCIGAGVGGVAGGGAACSRRRWLDWEGGVTVGEGVGAGAGTRAGTRAGAPGPATTFVRPPLLISFRVAS